MYTEKVLVGISGGVDSAVAALLLQRAGYDVVGGFIRTWHPEFVQCDEERDRLDAMRVAVHLGIPLITIDARDAYKNDVADEMIREYARGRTPNPDMLCNKIVKFGVMDQARTSIGASFLATGHYARIERQNGDASLHRGIDAAKDQSYFLAGINRSVLAHTLFPLGDMTKPDVRTLARTAQLPNASRRDSQGICFLGKIDMRTFLSHYIPLQPGIICDVHGKPIGTHDGATLYTIGERHGFRITDAVTRATPYYVIDKDMSSNTLIVDSAPPRYEETHVIRLEGWHALTRDVQDGTYDAVLRYHGTPTPCTLATNGTVRTITLHDTVDRPSLGQTCVLYRGDQVIASGIIETV
jgi:tRNA-specific 2-thiouridylase